MALKITSLSKEFDRNWGVRDVSLEVKRGEILGLFGASGEGKSVLMCLIAGADPSDSGTVVFESNDLSHKTLEERGFVFQPAANYPGTNNSDLPPGGFRQARDLDAALDRADGVLLLDNPFCFMDRQTRESKIRDLRRAVREKNLVVILATNDFEEIFLVCDSVAVVSGGAIIQTGAPREVYESPALSSVAATAGRNNLIAARRLDSTKSEISEFQTIDGHHRLFTDHVESTALGSIGQDHFLAIRPEHISISFGASFPEDNLLKAEITEIVYQGATTLIKLNAAGLILEALVLRLVGLNVGDECMVGLPPDRIRVLRF